MIKMMSSNIGICGLAAAAAIALLAIPGCGSREHLGPDYGVRERGFLAKQSVYREAATDNPKGLDSEELALIAASYRKSMGGAGKEESKQSPSRVLIVEESKKNESK